MPFGCNLDGLLLPTALRLKEAGIDPEPPTLTTDKRGRPYTLVCTKNQASYARRVRQRTQDLGHREQLAGG